MNRLNRWLAIGSVCILIAGGERRSCARSRCPPLEATRAAQPPIDFTRDIQPIFKQDCAECHGPSKARARLRLHTPELILRGGLSGPPITPGKSDESLLMRRVLGPRRRRPDAARRRSAARGGNRAAARVDRSGRAPCRACRRLAALVRRRRRHAAPPIRNTGRTSKPTRPELPPVARHGWVAQPDRPLRAGAPRAREARRRRPRPRRRRCSGA